MKHRVKPNASALHSEVFECLAELFPNYNIEQEKAISVKDGLGKPITLFIDIVIKELKIAIECQGKQHFEPNAFFFSEKGAFQRSKDNDSVKKKWCKDNGYFFVEISFRDKITKTMLEKRILEAIV
jgi:hypothetical protein